MASAKKFEGTPPKRCGYTITYTKTEFWGHHAHGGKGSITCWRPVEDGRDFCFWHKGVDNKKASDIPSGGGLSCQRLDGAYLRGIRFSEFPFTEDTVLNEADLTDIEATNCNLVNHSLNGANLFGAELRFSQLSKAELRSANLSEANLEESDLSGSHLRWAQIVNSNLREATLTAASGPDTKFLGSDLSNSTLSTAYLQGALFRGITAPEADISSCELPEANFESSTLKGADFSDSTLKDTTFDSSKIQNCDFTNCDISSGSFKDCMSTDANFTGVDALNVHFQGAKIAYANFSSASIRHSKFSESTAIKADFSDTDSYKSVFADSSLTSTDFSNSDLRQVDFSNSDLQGSVLESVDLRGANLDGSLLGNGYVRDVTINEDTMLGESGHEGHTLEAIKTYRIYLRLLFENSIGHQIPKYRILERKSQKERLYHNNKYLRGLLYSILQLSSSYGEKPARVLLSSGGVILTFTAAFSIILFANSRITPHLESGIPLVINKSLDIFIKGLYLSVSSFLGAASADTSGGISLLNILSIFESLLGTLLIALLIFTLGRVATR